MSQKSIETPNPNDVLEKEGLFEYHRYLVEGMRINSDGKIISFDILDNEHNRNALKDNVPVSMDLMDFNKENHNKVKYNTPLPPIVSIERGPIPEGMKYDPDDDGEVEWDPVRQEWRSLKEILKEERESDKDDI